jgi:hypothetical protein
MHIDNTYLTNRTVGQPEQPTPAPDATTRAAANGPPPEVSSHVPSPELLDLLGRVRQEPEVRPDVLARVAQRLSSGYYLSRQAATDTAEAIQNARE